MSAPWRPEREYRSAPHEGTGVSHPAAAPPRPVDQVPARLVLLTSGGGGHCMHIAECIERGELPGLQLAGIVTDNADAAVQGKCAARGLRCDVVDFSTFPSRADFNRTLAEHVAALQPALVGLVGYLRIVREPLLSAWQGRLFNLHPSLLPEYPGLDAIRRAYIDGRRRLGATLHHVDAGIDSGRQIALQAVALTADATLDEAFRAVHHAEATMLRAVLACYDPVHGFPDRLLTWPDLRA